MSTAWNSTLRELYDQRNNDEHRGAATATENAGSRSNGNAITTNDRDDEDNENDNESRTTTSVGQQCKDALYAASKTLRQVMLVLLVGIVSANLLLLAYVLLMYFYGLRDKRRGGDDGRGSGTKATAAVATTDTAGEYRGDSRGQVSRPLASEITSSVATTAGIASLLTSIPTLTAVLLLVRSTKSCGSATIGRE